MTGVFVVTLNAASPVRLASAPRIGVLVVRANVADPRPLIEAVSSGVFVERVKVTLPLPETISSPSGVLVVMLKLVAPSPGKPLIPVAVALKASAASRDDSPPPLFGIIQADGARFPFGTADLLSITAPGMT